MARSENRLGRETSPYLRQHRHDPVDWYPYGDEALAKARELDRPLFLSIGYSACHWCHVMAHESFADEETAALMNESVVAVKVDREERPDLDAIYMEAVVAASGHGGWPMSVFATPDGRPFFAGTYFPDRPRQSMPSFRQVLAAVADVWANRRDDVEEQADVMERAVSTRLEPPSAEPPSAEPPSAEAVLDDDQARTPIKRAFVSDGIRAACERLVAIADPSYGGFGTAPKFPQPLYLDLMLRAHAGNLSPDGAHSAIDVVLTALEAMASGGIYDHLGGGFSRYSVDQQWLVPHFEKMLYDQALLARVYLHAWQSTGDARWRQVLDETVAYVLSRLRHPSGGLCSAEDADSEGEEGRFYLWTLEQFATVLGPEAAPRAAEWYGVTAAGNFEGRTILHRPERGDLVRPPEIEAARQRLEAARSERVRPGLDDKVIVEWNAMTCVVLSEAAAATGEPTYRDAAVEVLEVLLGAVAAAGGTTPRLVGSTTGVPGFALDVAWLADACVAAFELTGRSRYLSEARRFADDFLGSFVDDNGLVFTTRADASPLLVRPPETHDGVTPSGASVGAGMLARLGAILGEPAYIEACERIVARCALLVEKAPATVPALLAAADQLTAGIEVVAVGSGRQLMGELRRRFVPSAVWVQRHDGDDEIALELFEGRDEDAVYVCRSGACRLPAATLADAERELSAGLNGPPPTAS